MRFSTVFVLTLYTAVATAVATAVGSSNEKRDDDWVKVDPVDYAGTIDASALKCDQSGLTYVCCDGPDWFDSWIVGGCDNCKTSPRHCATRAGRQNADRKRIHSQRVEPKMPRLQENLLLQIGRG